MIGDWTCRVRYEDGAWPLWRWDLGFCYGAKSLLHRVSPEGAAERAHHRRMAMYLSEFSSRPTHTDDKPDIKALRVAAVGDMMWTPPSTHEPISVRTRSTLAGSDLRFANLETPIDASRAVPSWTYARFNTAPSLLDTLNGLGPTTLSVCNNHSLDQGMAGLEATCSAIKSHPNLRHVGGISEGDALQIVECNSIRIAVLASTYGINPWGHSHAVADITKGLPQIRFGSAVRKADWARVGELFAAAKAQDPDLIFVLPHWGFEYEYWPSARQRMDAYRLMELGADVILGSSPHVLQPVEVVSINEWDRSCPVQIARDGPSRVGMIAYSLGNFLSSMPTLACNAGGILAFGIRLDSEGGTTIVGAHVVPTLSVRHRLARSRTTFLFEEAPCSPRIRTRLARHFARSQLPARAC